MPENTIKINANILLDPNADRKTFAVQPGDETTPANLTVADVKELCLAVNYSRELIQDLLKDLQRAETTIDKLERDVSHHEIALDRIDA